MKPVISIGIQDFEKIRENSLFYIDKTSFIKEWWENNDIVTLITRPRRFGKTLNINMVERFFSIQYADRSDLFEGLSIWNEEKYHKLQGSYPVIFLSFADIKANTFETARMGIINKLVKLYSDYDFVITNNLKGNFDQTNAGKADTISKKINDKDIAYYNSVNTEMTDPTAYVAINYMCDYLSRYYERKVIILLDEYDTPLQEAFINGYWHEMVSFIRNLFNSTFKTNPHIERGLMTGITRVSKESVFSDLNNLEVVTTTSNKYETSFGFTENEVLNALNIFDLSSEKNDIKYWYNGFIFGRHSDIYNPWSITKFLDSGELDTYWVDTSSNALVSKLIQESTADIKIEMEDLLKDKEINTELDEQVIFDQLFEKRGAIWSLLLASGYLKVTKKSMNKDTGKKAYSLKITNYETLIMFRNLIEGWFPANESAYRNFQDALIAGNLDYMNQYINQIALQTFSSFDSGSHPSERAEPERFYHGFVLGLIVDMSGKYHITSNRESGFGRYDVMLEPIETKLPAIIMEFKVFNKTHERNLEETAKNALLQIESKCYDEELMAKGVKKERIKHYGFAFEGKKILICQGSSGD